jgi:O-antigen/teichoic acid export membrane protein
MSLDEASPTELIEPALAAVARGSHAQRAKLARLREWGKRSGTALLDQACFSGANFLLYVLLARWLTPAEYGVFALVFSVYLFLLGLHTGLIQEPMSVLGHVAYGEDLAGYGSRVLRVHALLSLILAAPAAGVGVWLVWGSRDQLAHPMGAAFLSLAFSIPFLLLLWLARRMAYLHLAPHHAVVHSAAYAVLLLAGMGAMKATRHVSIALAFGVMAGASGVAGLHLLGKLGALRRSSGKLVDVMGRHVEFGKWLAAIALFTWLSRDAYIVLAAGLIGPIQAGALRAVTNLVTPLDQVQTALVVMLLPWFSSLCSRGLQERMRRRALQVTAALVALTLVYLGTLWPVASRVLDLAYEGKYHQFAWMVPWLILLQVLRALQAGSLLYLMAKQKTQQIFYAGAAAGAMTVVGAMLVRWWSLRGAVCGVLLSGVASTLLISVFYWRSIRNDGAARQSWSAIS